MKHTLAILVSSAILVACGTTNVNSDEPIRNQKLSTNFTQDGIKIETDCTWYKFWKSKCDVVSIESTAVVATNGASTMQRSIARDIAKDKAYANFAEFLNKTVTQTTVTNVIAKHIEKARDSQESKSELTDTEANKNVSTSRENSNDTARTITTNIQTNSTAIVNGFRVVETKAVGSQEISVTIRWDKANQNVRHLFNR